MAKSAAQKAAEELAKEMRGHRKAARIARATKREGTLRKRAKCKIRLRRNKG